MVAILVGLESVEPDWLPVTSLSGGGFAGAETGTQTAKVTHLIVELEFVVSG